MHRPAWHGALRVAVIAAVVISATGACQPTSDRNEKMPVTADPESVADSSVSFLARMENDIGFLEEARYVGDRIIVRDRYDPYLKLFSVDGELLWSGARDGGGPRELRKPQTLAIANDSTVFAFQRGRAGEWTIESDSLAFAGVHSIPSRFLPLGAVGTCGPGLMLYARDDEMFDADTHNVTPGPDVGYIHRVLFDDSIASIATLYREPRHYNAIAASGHAAVVMDDYGGRVVIYHRPGAHSAGYLLEVSCGGRIESSYSEQWLILGDSARVQIASPHALQWTAGIVAVPDGWLVAIHRFLTRGFYDVDENQLKTEIFTYRHGRLEGSVVVDGQWILTDYSSRFGVLMATAVPAPHFIRVPLIALVPSSDREIE